MTSLDVVYCSTKEEHIVDASVSPHALEPAHGGLRGTGVSGGTTLPPQLRRGTALLQSGAGSTEGAGH